MRRRGKETKDTIKQTHAQISNQNMSTLVKSVRTNNAIFTNKFVEDEWNEEGETEIE